MTLSVRSWTRMLCPLMTVLTVNGVAAAAASAGQDGQTIDRQREIERLSRVGRGQYEPTRLKPIGQPRELKFDTHFEETAPGRNSAANEWSAYGALRDRAFNNMGRDLRVRYPAYDLVFRMYDGEREIAPDSLNSFRLGLVRRNLPAIEARWEHDGLAYAVSVMAVPFDDRGAYDLYKLEIRNPGDPGAPGLDSKLAVGMDGPPDMRLEGNVVRGLGDAPFLLMDPGAPGQSTRLIHRDWGLCDKRAKSYVTGAGPGQTEEAISSTRIGKDGLPVVYRFKAKPGEKYTVYLAASPHISRLLGVPQKPGDLIFQYDVEGAPPQTVDFSESIAKKSRPICVEFDGAHDENGDGYVQVTAGVAANSRMKHTRLSAIYVFPAGAKVDDVAAICSGSMNGKCLHHINVGATPEVGAANQCYDLSDVGLCRLVANMGGTIEPGQTKAIWLKVPPIHRREPVSMGSYAHAFLQVLPGEAVPPFGAEQIERLRNVAPLAAWRQVTAEWDQFFSGMAGIETPDPILKDMYTSRMATRAILDVRISDEVWFNACSPFFYYDFAYRDQAYVVNAYDLAGLHNLAERLLKVYCMEVKDVPAGPIAFGEVPLQLGMQPDGLWLTRPGQFDAQGQNIWCLVEHYKLSGDRGWLEKTAYPYVKRGAQWIVHSRHKHMAEVKNPNDPRYGLIEPGAMEVAAMTKGMHHYYMDAWAILGLREAADAAVSLGLRDDARLFASEAADLKAALHRSMAATFKRTGLYEGSLWFGVENEGEGMYGFWGHTPLLWPTRSLDPHDPMLTATWRNMERMSNQWGGATFSEGAGGCWPYIGVDWAISYILRGEPEKTLDYFCGFTDTAGGTLSWGEGYDNARNLAMGDQPHFWADAQWVNLYRHLFVLEDGNTLLLTPATMRRWSRPGFGVARLPTHFGNLDLAVRRAGEDGQTIEYTFRLTAQGDQVKRPLDKIVVNARTPNGRAIAGAIINGKATDNYLGEQVIIPHPDREQEYRLQIKWVD